MIKPRMSRHRQQQLRRKLLVECLESRRLLAVDFELLKDIQSAPENTGSSPANIVVVGSTMFFTATTSTHGNELWKTDGTEAGTVLVKDIRTGTSGSSPNNLTNVNGTLFFSANDGTNGTELWKSNGTDAGTVRVKDIFPGQASSYIYGLTNVNGKLYFRANNGIDGEELWESDGTASGTQMVFDFTGDSGGSNPVNITELNGKLIVTATTEAYGQELFVALTNNEAPVLNTALNQLFPAINEDIFNSTGKTVLSLVGGVTDVDAGALKGIAITSVTGATTGNWQYTLNGGTSWVNVGTVSTSAALLLPSNASQASLRYVPNANFNGTVQISYRAWDQTSGVAATKVNFSTASLVGGATAFSTAIETAALTINPVNDAPQWLLSTPLPIGSITNSVANSPIYQISSLLSGSATDADSGALQGIAIMTMTPAAAGSLWYQLSGSTVWKQVTAVSTSSALLLPSNALLQFRPTAGFVGTFLASFRVWDRTSGAIEGRANLSTASLYGGTTPFSSALGQASLQITS